MRKKGRNFRYISRNIEKGLEKFLRDCGNRDSLEIALSQHTTVVEMFQRVSLSWRTRSRPFRRIAIPFFFLSFTFPRSSSRPAFSLLFPPPPSLSLSSSVAIIFFAGYYHGQLFQRSVQRKLPPANRDSEEIPSASETFLMFLSPSSVN